MSVLLLLDSARLVTWPGEGPLRGDALGAPDELEGVSVIVEGGRIAALDSSGDGDAVFDATGCTIIPGFVDPHTHIPFFGWRADEDAARLTGLRYETLHAEDRGIYRSARMLARASDAQVLDFCLELASTMLRRGTTSFETKSGYGLSIDGELRQLRLARVLSDRVPQNVISTCLAAHAVPKGKTEGEWVGEAAEHLLPVAAEEGLATFVDVYVESIAFTLEHAARLAESARPLGMKTRIHADQLEDGQSGAFAARWGFASADHLNHVSIPAVGDLAASDTVAVLLPGATFTLRQNRKPPARNLIEEGCIVALGTDCNPGTSPVVSMPFVIALACRLYGLRPLEALGAATVNGAHLLGLGPEVGRIEAGRRADLVVLDVPSFEEVAYRPDVDPVLAVVCGGELVHVAERARGRLRAGREPTRGDRGGDP